MQKGNQDVVIQKGNGVEVLLQKGNHDVEALLQKGSHDVVIQKGGGVEVLLQQGVHANLLQA